MEDPERTPHPAAAPPATQPMEWEAFLQQACILVDEGLSGVYLEDLQEGRRGSAFSYDCGHQEGWYAARVATIGGSLLKAD